MGMTDRQFDSYQAALLAILENALKAIKADGSTEELENLIRRLQSELNRP